MSTKVATAAVHTTAAIASCRICNLPLSAPSIFGRWEPAEDGWSDLVLCHDHHGTNAMQHESMLDFQPVDA